MDAGKFGKSAFCMGNVKFDAATMHSFQLYSLRDPLKWWTLLPSDLKCCWYPLSYINKIKSWFNYNYLITLTQFSDLLSILRTIFYQKKFLLSSLRNYLILSHVQFFETYFYFTASIILVYTSISSSCRNTINKFLKCHSFYLLN